MVNKRLTNYIKEGLKKGYSLGSLKSLLLKQGFSEKDIDDAIKALSKRRNLNLKPVLYVAIALVVLIILFFFIKSLLQKQPILDPMQKLPVYRQWAFDSYLTKPEYTEETSICKAIASDNPLLCASPQCKAEYYFVNAHKEDDASICNNIDTPYSFFDKDVCMASITKDPSKCNSVSNWNIKQVCYNFVSGKADDCVNIQDTGLSEPEDCRDYIILLKNVLISNNKSECSILKSSFSTETCYGLISDKETDCTDERATYIAYSIMASEFKNSSFCNMIKFSDEKESCLNRLNCEFITDKAERQNCMKEFL